MPELTATLKDGAKVAYNVFNEQATSKIPLVMIMGITGCMLDWQMFAEGVAKAGGRKVLIFDNRNIGNSYGDIANMTLDVLALDTIELLEQLKLTDVHLLGFSMGGMIAQQILLNHTPPFTVHKLIMASSACRRPQSSKIDMSSLEGFEAFILSLFDEEWVKNNTAILPLIRESNALKRRPLETMQAQVKALAGWDLSEKLGEGDWTGKIYVMHGKRDAVINFAEAEHTLSVAKGAAFVTDLPTLEYGHFFSAYFDPKTWSNAIESCLGQAGSANL